MTDEIANGLYWVRRDPGDEWQLARVDPQGVWFMGSDWNDPLKEWAGAEWRPIESPRPSLMARLVAWLKKRA